MQHIKYKVESDFYNIILRNSKNTVYSNINAVMLSQDVHNNYKHSMTGLYWNMFSNMMFNN
jgi:hypothetical protein